MIHHNKVRANLRHNLSKKVGIKPPHWNNDNFHFVKIISQVAIVWAVDGNPATSNNSKISKAQQKKDFVET